MGQKTVPQLVPSLQLYSLHISISSAGNSILDQISRLRTRYNTINVGQYGSKNRAAIGAFVAALQFTHFHFLPCRWMTAGNRIFDQIKRLRTRYNTINVG